MWNSGVLIDLIGIGFSGKKYGMKKRSGAVKIGFLESCIMSIDWH